jgi:1-acyl-sn-glycerol-3-phosphate acyltransferase
VIEPAATKPAATKPAGAKPAGAKPAGAKPAATKPAATKPAANKPAATKPRGTKTTGTMVASPEASLNGRRATVARTIDFIDLELAGRAARSTADLAPEPSSHADVWDQRVAGLLRFLRRRLTGRYDVDEFGFDPELTEAVVYPMLRLVKERYFRIETSGVANLPDGSALLVANHSGTLPLDALMLTIAVYDDTPTRRHLRLLGADLVFRLPVLSEIARKAGSTMACNPDAERLLRGGDYVGVFPEGFKGIGKPYRDRYKLQRFGRGGFVAAALRTGAPIVPVSIVGAEEIYPIVGNLRPLARMTGLPYLPITPLFPWLGPLGMLPLPSKWLIEFGEPIETSSNVGDVDDPLVVFHLADQVRETIQHTLHTLLQRRPDPFA